VAAEFALPFAMACRVVAPVKAAAFKLTFETNRDPPPLSQLFEDLFLVSPAAGEAARGVAASAMTVRYTCGDYATVLVSKQGGRYRLQADTFEAMYLLSAELVRPATAWRNALALTRCCGAGAAARRPLCRTPGRRQGVVCAAGNSPQPVAPCWRAR
jgi:hypothetical protein